MNTNSSAESALSELLAAVRPGDVLVMRRDEPISQLIRWMDDSDPEHPVDLSHSMLVVAAGDEPEGFSAWPLPDEPNEIVSDIVIAPLRRLLTPYDRVIVLRHQVLAELDDETAAERVAPVIERAREYAERAQRGKIVFDDRQLYAKAIAFITPHLRRRQRRLAAWVLGRLDDEILSAGAQQVICPELIMRAFNTGDGALPITTSPTTPVPLGQRGLQALAVEDVDVDLSEVAWNSFKRELQVGACVVAVDLLVRAEPDPPPRIGDATPAQMIEYTTPGDLQRSGDLTVVDGWQAWSGRIADVTALPGGREAVKRERLAGPGATDTDPRAHEPA